jgi:predicted dehydrogenase
MGFSDGRADTPESEWRRDLSPPASPVQRIGLVGLGYWGNNYARLLTGPVAGGQLVACADLDERKRDTIRQFYPEVRTYRHARDLLDAGGLDAAVVAVHASQHRPVVEDCFEAGLHVLVEKPLATLVEDAEAMLAAAAGRGLTLMVGHTFLYNPAVQLVKRYIEDSLLGRLLYFSFTRTGLGPIREDVNALWDLAPHDLSMLRYWLGADPIDVTARGNSYLRMGVEDIVFVTLRYPGDVLAGIHVSWLDPVKDRRVTIVGDQKMVVFDDVSATEKLRVYDRGASYQPSGGDYGEFVAAVRDGDIVIPKVDSREPLRVQMEHFVECIRTGRKPISDGEDGLAVVKALEAAQRELRASSPAGASVEAPA